MTDRGNRMIHAAASIVALMLAAVPAHAAGLLTAVSTLPAGAAPKSLVLADLNGDGVSDLATADYAASTVTVRLGGGGGAFGAAVSHAVGRRPLSINAVDLDRDGDLDLLVADELDNDVSVLVGDGAGGFAAALRYTVGPQHPSWLGVADLDADKRPDLVVLNSVSDELRIMYGTTDGFVAGPVLATGKHPIGAALGDLDADGVADIVVLNNTGRSLSLYLGDGAGGFSLAATYPVGRDPQAVVLMDVQGDGVPDAVVSNAGDDTISILDGTGNGFLVSAGSFPASGAPAGLATGDFNGDCVADIAVASTHGAAVLVLPGDGNGGFGAEQATAAGGGATALAMRDLNGDLRGDLTVANVDDSTVSVLLGASEPLCRTFMVRRSEDPALVRSVPPRSLIDSSPFDDDPGTLGDGKAWFYVIDHAGGLDARISAHANRTSGAVRLGFDDGDPIDAPVDPSHTQVAVDLPPAAGAGMRVATVTIRPVDRDGTDLGCGLDLSVDVSALLPATLDGGIVDEGNGRYTFRVRGSAGQSADVVVDVEGTVLTGRTVIYF